MHDLDKQEVEICLKQIAGNLKEISHVSSHLYVLYDRADLMTRTEANLHQVISDVIVILLAKEKTLAYSF